MSGESSLRALAVTRISIGALTWLAPNLAGTLFGFDVKRNRQMPYMTRLFGIRDLIMGVALLTTRGQARDFWIKTGIAADAADAAAAAIGHRDGYLPAPAAVLVGATAVGACTLGVLGAGAEDRPLP